MIRSFCIACLFLFLFIVFTSSGSRKKSFIPPGTVQINDTLFCDVAEITNFDWLEFLEFQNRVFGKESDEYQSALPDTLVRHQKLSFCEPYVAYYFRHPAYRNYPVVGVSYEQAQNYCKWRTEQVHVLFEIKNGKRSREEIAKPYASKLYFSYRLPTKQEWEGLAMIGTDPKAKEKYLRKNKWLFNFKDSGTHSYTDEMTEPVTAYLPNKLGLYNLLGNVSEMIAEKGISKGGSWKDKLDSTSVWKDERYDVPNSYTGFRCVCVLKKQK